MNNHSPQEGKILDCKPVVTHAGDASLFAGLESSLIDGLPRDPSDWRRSYGRPSKSVYIEAMFVPFQEEALPKDGERRLIGRPIFHVYWTECVDVETYKNSVREDLESWFKSLAKHDSPDWMIVIVETPDVRKANKLLPRTTVLDKIRADFAPKHADRCLSVIHPIRCESRSAESWRGLLSRLRLLLLSAYNRALSKYGELVRAERERRNEQGWSFCKYFMLQEEQAFVLEMLGLYDEALVQYDELDVLFNQFVLNSNAGESPAWLADFQRPIESWAGLCLSGTVNLEDRARVGDGEASLLQFRAYLFTRQCALLLLMCKPWEIAQRCLPFLHNCLNELNILEVDAPAGATACWVALACLEVLHTCERFHDSGQVEQYSLYTASLWAYARDKLRELGELCGLMPGGQPSSAQLDTVVWLSAGMGDPPTSNSTPSPVDTLNDALSSQQAFQKHYLELAELAMGTYKHIGRIRSARLIGRDLAAFYRRLGQAQKAAAFLGDALATFREEGWSMLETQTLLELAECFRDLGDKERLAKACACIAGVKSLNPEVRKRHFDELLSTLDSLSPESRLTASITDAFELQCMSLEDQNCVVRGSDVSVNVSLSSLLPNSLSVTPALSLCKASTSSKSPAPGQSFGEARLPVLQQLDFRQDRTLGSASIVCATPKQFLRRRDSQPKGRRPVVAVRGDFSVCLTSEPAEVKLQPGPNCLRLSGKAGEEGTYSLGQLSLLLRGRLEFLTPTVEETQPPAPPVNGASPPRRRHSRLLPPRPLSPAPLAGVLLALDTPSFTVETRSCEVRLASWSGTELLARLPQKLRLTLVAGSESIAQGTELKLQAARGLVLGAESSSKEEMNRDMVLVLPSVEAGATTTFVLNSVSTPPPNASRNSSLLEYKVTVSGPWGEEKFTSVHYVLPMQAAVRLHTAQHAKFVQVCVTSLCAQRLALSDPVLESMSNSSPVVSFKPLDCGSTTLMLGPNCPVSYMWGLQLPEPEDSHPIKARFHVLFRPADSANSGPYSCEFELTDYRTLYIVSSRVEPGRGSEFCRVGALCHLQLTIERIGAPASENGALMYELLSDQSTWAVCGRTAGVVTLDTESSQSVTLDVMPLTGGFLPHPLVRLSKYIPAELKSNRDAGSSHSRLQPFSPGQVYNSSKSQQVHVLVSAPSTLPEAPVT